MRLSPRAIAVVAAATLGLTACNSASNSSGTTLVTPVVNSFVVPTDAPATSTTFPTFTTLAPPTAPAEDPADSSTDSALSSTTNPDIPSVTIARGAFLTNPAGSCTPTTCKRVDITTGGWEPRASLEITCYSSLGTTGPYIKTADRDGMFASSTLCFYGNATNVYVVVNGVSSNVITPWKDW
jgi:hypothetical protein